VIQLQHIYT